jgi:hypothetical protein
MSSTLSIPNWSSPWEKQSDHTINYLDLTISNHSGTLDCIIFCKPTATDTIIHSASCHSNEQKRTAVRYLNNRVNTYMLPEESKKREKDVIETILQNSGYHTDKMLSYRQLKHPRIGQRRIKVRNISRSPAVARQCEWLLNCLGTLSWT